MKKKAITLLLSLVLASGNIGNVQVLAADTTEQEAEVVQEAETTEQDDELLQEEAPAEEADVENAAEDISEPVEEEEPVPGNEEQVPEDKDFETDEAVDEEEFDISEEAAADVLETEENEITDESIDALADVVDSGSCGDDITWTLTGTGSDLTLTFSGSGPMDDLWESNIPWASNRAKVKRVIIEDGITSVGDYVCYSLNRMTEVSLPDSLTYIGEYGFANCLALKSVRIPGNVTKIYEEAFSGCSAMTSITIPDSVTSIGDSAFSGCSSLTEIDIPDSVSYIGSYAFSECSNLTNIIIPDGVTGIEYDTFYNCSNLSSITIPDSVTYIGGSAFSGCDKLNRINFSDLASWVRINFNYYTGIRGDLYLNGNLLTEIVIPDGTTEISSGPFTGITSIKKVTIPESVTKIGSSAFSGCSGLTDVNIPDSVTSIEDNAFYGCSSLSSINIPDSVKNIGYEAFEKCDSLKSLTIPDSVTSIEWDSFPRRYWDTNDFVIFTQNSYVKDFCELRDYAYFDKTAPSIAKLTSHNGSDIRVFFDKKGESLERYDYDDTGKEFYYVGYQIKYADNKNMTGAKSVFLKDKKAASKVITGLKNGKTYYVQIQHYLKNGKTSHWSKWSQIESVTVGQTPYNTNVSKLSTYIGSHIKIDWTKTAGASGYHIKYADNSSMTGAKEVFVKGNSTFTKTLTGLKNGKTYYVKIQTYRTVSGKTYWSSWSPAKSIKVDQIPYGSSIKKLTQESSTKMKVTWDKAPSASGYHIQYRWYDENQEKSVTKDVFINSNGTLSKTITGLKTNTYYDVRIQTFRKVSGKTYWSSWSKEKDIYLWK